MIVLITIGLYLIVSVFLGFYASRHSTNSSEDYFVANRDVSWKHLAFTLFASWISTFAFIASPGFYYSQGVSWLFVHGLLATASPFLMWFIGRKIWFLGKIMGYITPGDLLGDFYQNKLVKLVVAFVSLIALVPYCLIQLIGIGKAVTAISGGDIPYWVGIAFASFGVAVYTLAGGVRAIVWTDIMQTIIFALLMLIGVGLVLYEVGGLDGFAASIEVRPEAFVFDHLTVGQPLTVVIIWTFGYILLPHMWQRAYMAKSCNALSKSIMLSAFMTFFLIIIPSLLIGMLGISLFPEGLEDSDKFIPLLFAKYMPALSPIVILATFAAGMSTVDSQLISASSVFVRDIVQPFFRHPINTGVQKLIGRIMVFLLIVGLTLLAFLPESQGSIISIANKGVAVSFILLVPLLGPMFMQKSSKYGGIASLMVGIIITILFDFIFTDITFPFGFGTPIVAFFVQIVVFIVFGWIVPRTDEIKDIYPKVDEFIIKSS